MKLKEEEVKEIILKNKATPQWVADARAYHKDWKALVYGLDYKEKLLKIEHIESDRRAEPRKKYAIPIKDTVQKLTKPIDNVYSAVGGSKNYLLKDNQLNIFLENIRDVRDGISIEKWLETYWAKDLYIVDPSGVLFLEYLKNEWVKPTYKSIDTIRCYKSRGQQIDWLLFEPVMTKVEGLTVEKWRFVDDETDYTFKKIGEEVTLIKEETFKHPFGTVPALINSNINRLGNEFRYSPFDCVKERLEEYLRDQSILTIYKFQNGFPISYRPGIICQECRGTGKIEHQKCESCNGTGELFRKDVTDEIILPIMLNGEEINIPENVGGMISPNIEIWNKYDEVLEKSTMSMYDSLWGITIDKERDQTATEVMLNAQPKINKLNEWSDVAQFMEWQLTELIANWQFTKNKDDKISNIYYGRVYLIRTSKEILTDLSNSIKDGLPDSVKNRLYQEYITTKYKNDPENLMIELKKSVLEYWPFYSLKDVLDILGRDAARKKMLFVDWWESLTIEDKLKDESALEVLRDKWIDEVLTKYQINENSNS